MRKRQEIESAFSPREALEGRHSFFLVGIGGAGMSALARMLKHRGFEVEGSDAGSGPENDRLRAEGIRVSDVHRGDILSRDHALVLSDAIDLDSSPEVRQARELAIPIVRRSQALGWLLKGYRVIAVTGTHGKTTTTGMTGAALIAGGLDPLVVVGASIPQWSGPVREGKGDWAVVEACEAYDSFHDLDPEIVVLTNLELDHVDYHGTWENLRDSVVRFASKVGVNGRLIYCAEDPGASEIAALIAVPKRGYSSEDSGALSPAVPGLHNLLNASAALVAAESAGAETGRSARGVAEFRGAERRLQNLGDVGGVTVIDDYAHHPTEIRATIQAVRESRPKDRLIAVFQPHLYSRTAPLIDEFAEALSLADQVFLTDIYPAREAPMPGVSAARIVEKITKLVHYVPSRHLLAREVAAVVRPGDAVVGMGAGNISEFGPALVNELLRAKRPPHVAILYGGDSTEREVSLHSGLAVYRALTGLGYDAKLMDVSDVLLRTGDLGVFAGDRRPEVAFLAVHGTRGEDGALQGLLELLHIPYTGSGIQSSALAMDKAMTKQILDLHGVRTPRGVRVTSPADDIPFPGPYVVKPNAQGSTVGLTFVERDSDVCAAIEKALGYGTEALVEEWIHGMEISTPVLIDRALPPVEIAPASGVYDYASKYLPGATQEIIPARLPAETLDLAHRVALRCHQVLGCRGATRTDAIVREGEIVVLEVNTLPGLTGTSLLPNSAAAAGIAFPELCRILVEDALGRPQEAG